MLKISLFTVLLAVLYAGCGSNGCCKGDVPLDPHGESSINNLAPTSVISSQSRECTEGNAITFDGRSSADSDGFIKQYEWLLDGKEAATSPVPSFSCDKPGEKKVCLKVIDDNGLSSSYVCQTFVVKAKEAVKIAPVAVVAAPALCTIGETIDVNASGSGDSDGEIVSYAWDFDGLSADTAKASFLCAKEGEQKLCLKVTDNDALTDENCTVVIGQQVPNKAPVAKIKASATLCVLGEKIELDGSESSDEDGSIYYFNWDPPAVDTPVFDFSCDSAGIHTVCLSVVDNKGLNSTQVCETISVSKPANKPPVAKIELLPQECTVGEDILADGTTSSDTDGNITAYLWSLDQNSSFSTEPKPVFKCDTEGVKHICLKVTDNEGAVSENEACQDVTVKAKPIVSIPPVAVITIVQNDDPTPSITADCAGSYDPDTIDGDNNPQNDGKILSAVFTVSKTYQDGFTEDPHDGVCPKWISTPDNLKSMQITLTVTDDDGEITQKTNIYDWDGTKLILREE